MRAIRSRIKRYVWRALWRKKLIARAIGGINASETSANGAAAVQRALNKWWRVALNMFGPPRTERTDLYIRLGLKYRSNEERRQLFRRDCERQIVEVGLKVPKLYHESFPYF